MDDPTAGALAPLTPMALIDRALAANIDPDKMGKLLDMQERWERTRAAERFAEAVTGFQRDMPPVLKARRAEIKGREGGRGYEYAFASYDDVMRVAAPLLAQYGIVVTFSTDQVQGQAALKTTCRLRVGTHVEEHTLTVPVPSQMSVNDTQKFGAALSYAKRYAFCAALNVVVTGEDSDAGRVLETVTEAQQQEIRRLMAEKDVHPAKWQTWLDERCGGSTTIEQIPSVLYPHVLDALKRKGTAVRGRNGGG